MNQTGTGMLVRAPARVEEEQEWRIRRMYLRGRDFNALFALCGEEIMFNIANETLPLLPTPELREHLRKMLEIEKP